MSVKHCARLQTTIGITLWLALTLIARPIRAQGDAPADLQQMLSRLPADATTWNIPAGVYHVTETLEITRPDFTVQGAGIGKTILVRDPMLLTSPMVKINGVGSSISDMTLDGNGAESVLSLKQANTVADKVEVKNFMHIGIVVPGSGCRVTHSIVTGYSDPNIRSIGIWHDSGPNVSQSSIMIDHDTIRNNGINGVFCTGGKIDILDNHFTGNHVQVVPVGGGQMCLGNNGRLTNPVVATISGNTITDGGGPKASGIETAGGSYTITNNTICNHGHAGIVIGVNAARALISGNVIYDCGQDMEDRNSPPLRAAIYVLYGANNVEIVNNRCFDDQPRKTQTYGVLLAPPTRRTRMRFPERATEHVVIRNNDFRGNLHPEGMLDESQATDRSVAGNYPPQANR